MRTAAANKLFVKRVQLALGWACLIGLTAGINLIPGAQHTGIPANGRSIVITHPMVVPPPMVPVPPAPVTRPLPRTAIQPLPRSLSKHDRIVQWFGQYDRIRQRAKMSGAEKATAIRLWASSFVTTSQTDTNDAQQLLSSMARRYDRAEREMASLPSIAETKTLQQGYVQFFRQARADFQNYLATLEKQSTRAALVKMQSGKQHLAVIDVRNKNLDRQLRRQYKIREID